MKILTSKEIRSLCMFHGRFIESAQAKYLR